MARNIYVVGGANGYANWMQGKILNKLENSDLVVFTGGEDVSPEMYGKKAHPATGYNITRDLQEREVFKKAVKLNKKMIGICRGSQFLCAMNKGILIQHQENPEFIHNINTFDGKIIPISSTHHQAQFPFVLPEDEYKVLGWTNGLSRYHYGQGYDEELNPPKECEIVYYNKTKSLSVQGHPECLLNDYPETIGYLRKMLDNLMADEFFY
jgi:phosphoribosylformylglycinamidine (FGAM) synthase-like amidotransferase family enzyme